MKAQLSKFYPAFPIGGIFHHYLYFYTFFLFFIYLREVVLVSDGFLSSSSVLSSSAGFAGLHFPFAMIMPVFT